MTEAEIYKALSVSLDLNRIYPVLLPEDSVLPAVTYQQVSAQPIQHRDRGQSKKGVSRRQFTVFHNTRVAAWALAERLEEALSELGGSILNRMDGPRASNSDKWSVIIDANLWR